MSLRPFRDIHRKKTKVINVGDVKIGGDNPISVQSMTNTLTTDVQATIKQINDIHEEGADLVRVSCPDEESSLALKKITKNVSLPIIADIHFHYKRAIEAAENGAKCLRINPGNIGDKSKIHEVLSAARNNGCSIRIGVNAGSLEKDILEKYKEPCPEALVESALRNIQILEDQDFFNFKISAKSSDVFLSMAAYRQLSKVTDYPLHLGITEAGSFISGSIKSSMGLGSLLMDGIGDTIRVSLSDDPVKEIKIGNEILKSLNLRNRGVKIISCPSCARQAFQVIDTVKTLEEKLSHIKTPLTLSIIGCVVNGPGEAAMTDIGITGGGKGNNMLYLSGIQSEKVLSKDIISKVVSEVEKKAAELDKKLK
ncbi:flavodoxin-dependent (E)-4-hydroxy-3-methylbut-2-enyl-diphosphate synthase [Candidatus Pelagibacter sp.]|jgi:(E)-4-hydroxy-3-methylbut-2-enyl-diphosphate synthase|nr:flavodoxin-dependent (E)-4-hydroxy-3-methylbut-2-enyl-diphosphate synthase [Candidatus Pelagibacter sp.]